MNLLVVSVAGYVAVAGGILSAVNQMAVSPVVSEGGISEEKDPEINSG